MLNDAVKNAYTNLYSASRHITVTSRTIDDVFNVPTGFDSVELAIDVDPVDEVVDLVVVLPTHKVGKRIRITNNCAIASGTGGYFVHLYEVVDGVPVEKDIPSLYNPTTRVAELEATDLEWCVIGHSVSDSIGVLWNILKYDTILWFGQPFDNIEDIYEEEEFEVPATCGLVYVSQEELVESRQLALHFPVGFSSIGKILSVNVSLTGVEPHTLDLYVAPDVSLNSVPNGQHTFMCFGDISTRYVTWFRIAYVPPEGD